MRSRKIFAGICVLFLLIALSPGVRAAEAPPSPLPPQAQQAIKKGLLAVEQKEWPLAVRYFEEARKADPLAPEVLFNLGLSESMIPGRELRSISWFQAYLSAGPAAANAAAVKEMIEKLEVRVEGTMGKLAGQARQIAGQFPHEHERFGAYSRVAVAMAQAGDPSGAAQIASLIPNKQESNLASIAGELAKAGDIAGAKAIAARMEGEVFKPSAFQDISIAQAESGDTEGARATLEGSTHPGYRHNGSIAIAKALYKRGEKEEAWRTLVKAADATTQSAVKYADWAKGEQTKWEQDRKAKAYSDIGRAQAEIGDVKGALRTADLIPQQGTVYSTNARGDVTGSTTSSQFGDQWKGHIYSAIVRACQSGMLQSSDEVMLLQELAVRMKEGNEKANLLSLLGEKRYKAVEERLRASDARGALNTAAAISDPRYKSKAYEDITRYLLGKGDLASAQAQLESISDAGARTRLSINLAEKFARRREERKARDILSKARNFAQANKNNWALRDIASAQVEAGDLDGAMDTAAVISSSGEKGSTYASIARAQLAVDDLSGAKKTAGLMADDGNKHSTLYLIADKEAETGRVEDAKRTASAIPDEVHRNNAFFYIAQAQALRGDFRGALISVESITKDTARQGAYRRMAELQLRAGYAAAARETIGKAKELAARMNDPAGQTEAFCSLGDMMIKPFHVAAQARELLASAGNAASRIADPGKRSEAQAGYSGLYRSQQGAGVFTGSRESFWAACDAAHLMKGFGSNKANRFESLAKIQARGGDLIGAQKTGARIGERQRWESAMEVIASAAAGYGNVKAAEEIAGRLRSKNKKERVYLAILKAEAEKGRIDAAQRALARITDQNRLDDANEAMASAFLRAGDMANAKDAASRLKRDPGSNLAEAMTEAGALDWAWQAAPTLKSDYDEQRLYRCIAEAQARSGDLTGAKKTASFIRNHFQTALVCTALAKAGDSAWALEWAAGIKNIEYRYQAYREIAAAMAERGDTAGAKRVLGTIKKGGLTLNRARDVAGIQVKMDDIAGAMETLAAIHPKDAEFESWAAYEIASRQLDAQWKQTAAGIKDDYWKTKLLSEKAESLEDRAAAAEAAAAIPDSLEKSLAYLVLARRELKNGNLSGASELAGLIPDTECRMLVLSELTFSGITRVNLMPILPMVQQLPDSAGKAYILLDAATALVEAGNPKSAAALLSAALKAGQAMHGGFWKARTYMEISKIASAAREEALSANAGHLAETSGADMKEGEKTLWGNYRARPEPLDLEQIEAAAARKKRTEKWSKFIQSDLNKPLFLDIQSHIQSLAGKTKPWDMFNGFTDALKDTAAMLKKSKQLAGEK